MPDNFSYISILNPGFSTVPGVTSGMGGNFAYVSFLNPPSATGGTVTTTGATSYVSPPRSIAWYDLGAWVGTTSPGAGVRYVDWLAGSSGYWLWVRIP